MAPSRSPVTVFLPPPAESIRSSSASPPCSLDSTIHGHLKESRSILRSRRRSLSMYSFQDGLNRLTGRSKKKQAPLIISGPMNPMYIPPGANSVPIPMLQATPNRQPIPHHIPVPLDGDFFPPDYPEPVDAFPDHHRIGQNSEQTAEYTTPTGSPSKKDAWARQANTSPAWVKGKGAQPSRLARRDSVKRARNSMVRSESVGPVMGRPRTPSHPRVPMATPQLAASNSSSILHPPRSSSLGPQNVSPRKPFSLFKRGNQSNASLLAASTPVGENFPETPTRRNNLRAPPMVIKRATPKSGVSITPICSAKGPDPVEQAVEFDQNPDILSDHWGALEMSGDAPSGWEFLVMEGLWPHIMQYLEPWDLAIMTRVSKYVKYLAEIFLYQHLNFSPIYPHGTSYAHLCNRLVKLVRSGNGKKLKTLTTRLTIGAGWEKDTIMLMDQSSLKERRLVTTDCFETVDGVISGAKLKEFLHGEGLTNDGGHDELTVIINVVIQLTIRLQVLTWDSSIPIKADLLKHICNLWGITRLRLNLGQLPGNFIRNPDNLDDFKRELVPKYRPEIGSLGNLFLVDLQLFNLPTRNQEWWAGIYFLIASVSPTLRHLSIEMPDITPERYPHLFDPKMPPDPKKHPPMLAWHLSKEKATSEYRLGLETFAVRGVMLDQNSINFEMNPSTLKKVQIMGCYPQDFWLSRAHTANITSFSTDNWGGFFEAVRMTSCTGSQKKEIAFTPHIPGDASKLLERTMNLQRLLLSASCSLDTKALEIFLESRCTVEELHIPVTRLQWPVFVGKVALLRCLKNITVFVGDGSVDLRKGPHPRYPAHDAEEIMIALEDVGVQLKSVHVGTMGWSVDYCNGRGKIRRSNQTPVPGPIGRVLRSIPKGRVTFIDLGHPDSAPKVPRGAPVVQPAQIIIPQPKASRVPQAG